ncbi:hypothetical protein HMPREF9372_3558 [Sporosarcina newyorkensis 2681]|uniref:Uncharacterized protein n=1 Tax=Sporosarcina newyorkensis 2681 TaxID=1027292 RepID=F9DXM7_9BACL|nr:hypothetical protein HMPREF9372_3558 [Sporosarcina newyorkensis 2681]
MIIKSFEKIEGAAHVPDYYKRAKDRKIVENDANIFEVLKNPNRIILTAYGILLTLVVLLALLIVFIVKRRRCNLGTGEATAK